jgi:predicted MFS family arabinose efflux permease
VSSYALLYLGLAFYFVNAAPFLMSSTGPSERNHVISTQVAFLSIASFGGSLIGGLLPGWFAGWLGETLDQPTAYRYPLLLAAALVIPAIFSILAAQEPPAEIEQEPVVATPGRWRISRNPVLGVILIMALARLFQVAGMGTAWTFFNVYMDASLHVPTTQIGLLAAVGRLLSVPMALVTPSLTAKWGNGAVAVWGSLAASVGMLPLALSSNWLVAGLGFIAVTSISSIRYAAYLVYVLELVPARQRGAMSGAGEMAAGFSFAGMAVSGGFIIATLGYQNLFMIGLGLSLIGTVIFWIYYQRKSAA